MSMPHPPGCPACGGLRAPEPLEEHFDRYGGTTYRIRSCLECGVVFSEPREPVGSDWYVKSAPLRGRRGAAPPETDWRFRQFLSESLPPGRLLDVGCGDGGFMDLVRRRGWRPVGFDYDARVAEQARARGLEACAMEFEKFTAGRREGEFDAVTLFDVLEHTPEPAWFFARLARLLKPGGHAVVTLPNGLRPLPWGREEHDYPPHHFTRWTPESLGGFLRRQGFEIVRQKVCPLRARFLADHCFFYRVMPGVLSLAKRVLFGRKAREGRTLSELCADSGAPRGGTLRDPLLRQRAVDAARAGFQALGLPLWLILRSYYTSRRPFPGDLLYTVARRVR